MLMSGAVAHVLIRQYLAGLYAWFGACTCDALDQLASSALVTKRSPVISTYCLTLEFLVPVDAAVTKFVTLL